MAIKRGSKIDMGSSSASMTDLVFLLLLFFILATTLIGPSALKLVLPESGEGARENAYTTVSITADGQYFVETEQVQPAQLESRLQQRLSGDEDPVISLHCDESVTAQQIVDVMSIGLRNRYKVVLAVAPVGSGR